MSDIFVGMPLQITPAQIKEIRNNDLTRCEDNDEMNKRIGWLICVYDLLIEHRPSMPEKDWS